jgi:hypothetical protein
MGPVNTDKSRHALARSKAARDRQARRDWLAAMTPEHRALHEQPLPVICAVCVQRSFAQATASIQALSARLNSLSPDRTPRE